ncbi:DUF1997 domain-containing protein [Acaryochloris thomasi]|nr:DUF1997 domain-containing protein [Acaryochloris thomasi]
MQVNFTGSQAISVQVPTASAPLQHYLRQPHRLIYALADRRRVERLSDSLFRLSMRPREFMALKFQPVVDLQVWSESNGKVHVRSEGCELRGIDYINDRFKFNLIGELHPVQRNGQTWLEGGGDLKVGVELPPLFWMTPKPILEAAGHSLLQGILMTFKQRIGQQLIADYQEWAGTRQLSTASSSTLSANPSTF